jgi:hypothetical protein
MTNPESEYPFLHWPIKSSSNLSDIYKQNEDNSQIFHLPTRSIPLTYLQQQKEQAVATFSTYVFSLF